MKFGISWDNIWRAFLIRRQQQLNFSRACGARGFGFKKKLRPLGANLATPRTASSRPEIIGYPCAASPIISPVDHRTFHAEVKRTPVWRGISRQRLPSLIKICISVGAERALFGYLRLAAGKRGRDRVYSATTPRNDLCFYCKVVQRWNTPRRGHAS